MSMQRRTRALTDGCFADKQGRFVEMRRTVVPRRWQRHYSYNESLNEPAWLIADEPADIEEETPAEANEPIEEIEPNNVMASPAFEE